MAIFSISKFSFLKLKVEKHKSGYISLILAQNEKNKTTLFSSTLKVEAKKVVLFFHFELRWARYGHWLVYKEMHTYYLKRNLGPNQDLTSNTTKGSEIFCGVLWTLMEPEKHQLKFWFWNHCFKGGPNGLPILY